MLDNASEKIVIRQAKSDDLEVISQLCDRRYGRGYLRRDAFMEYMKCPELFVVGETGGELAGFAVMVPSREDEVIRHMQMPPCDVKKLSQGKKALIYKSLAVDEQHEKIGLPVKMSEHLLSAAKNQGYGIVFASAWIIDGNIPIGKMFDSLQFIPLYEKQNLWYDDEDYSCIVCGGRCRCDAMLFYRYI